MNDDSQNTLEAEHENQVDADLDQIDQTTSNIEENDANFQNDSDDSNSDDDSYDTENYTDDDKEFNFYTSTKKLSNWVIGNFIPEPVVNDLLTIMREDYHNIVPQSFRSLLHMGQSRKMPDGMSTIPNVVNSPAAKQKTSEAAKITETKSREKHIKKKHIIKNTSEDDKWNGSNSPKIMAKKNKENDTREDFLLTHGFPIETESTFQEIELNCNNNDEFVYHLKKYLSKYKPKENKFAFAFRQILTDEFLIDYNWDGSHGKKSLAALKFFSIVLFEAWASPNLDRNTYKKSVQFQVRQSHIRYSKNKKKKINATANA